MMTIGYCKTCFNFIDNINQALSNNRAEFLKQEKQKIYEGNSFGAFS
jgi:hypothetical protein